MEGLRSGQYYHIYNHANGDDNLLKEAKNYSYFLAKYQQHINPIAETIAWCLMPNHFHLLIRIKEEVVLKQDFPKFETLENPNIEEKELKLSYLLSKQFSNFFSSYSQSFNKVYQRRGSLFLKNFKRKLIDSEAYLFQLIIYIHLNPVKHGFTLDLSAWEWSSYQTFCQKQSILIKELFRKENNYHSLHLEKLDYFKEYYHIEEHILNA
jgi:REP element-mobilizing transposase RayT